MPVANELSNESGIVSPFKGNLPNSPMMLVMAKFSDNIEAIIFDLDGTLVDTNLDFASICAFFGVAKGTDILAHVETLSAAEKSRALEYIHEQEIIDAHQSSWLPGAEAMLKTLRGMSVPTAIVTRNSRAASAIKIERNGIDVDYFLSREDAKPKPEPDGLLKVASHLGLSPQRCVYVGDYRYDLEAAVNAGMVACLYTGSHLDSSGYSRFMHLADIVFGHYDDFLNCLRNQC